MAGAIVGGVTSGIEAYSEGERGADLAMDVVGGMLSELRLEQLLLWMVQLDLVPLPVVWL